MQQKTIEEVSAGGVVRRASDGKYLLGKHSGYHKWVLPKGLVERGESYTETAEREVWEETGVRARVVEQAPVKAVEYWYQADMEEVVNKNPHTQETTRRVKKYQESPAFAKSTEGRGRVRVHKQVYFYLMELMEERQEHGWEMEDKRWVSYEEGVKTLAFESEREVLRMANELVGAPAGT